MNTEVLEKNLKEAQDAVARSPDDAQLQIALGKAYFHLRGKAYFHLRRYEEALTAFERAADLDPDSAVAHGWIGRVYYEMGPVEKARDAYQRAAELDQRYTEAHFGLGLLYLWKIGDNEAAVAALQEGLRHNPDDPLLTTGLGSAYAFSGQFDDAIAALERAIDLQPDNAFAYGWLVLVYLHLQRYDEMIEASRREIEIEDTHDAHRPMGYVYAWRGLHGEAIHQFERALSLAPDDYEARAALAMVYREVGRTEDAEREYALAHDMAMKDDEYGQSCFEAVSGHRDRALDLLEAAVTGRPAKKNWARLDPEFAAIKDDVRFQALTA